MVSSVEKICSWSWCRRGRFTNTVYQWYILIEFAELSKHPQLEQTLRFDTVDGDQDSSRSLAQQNVDLRRRLEEEQAAYKRKLTAYQEGQQRQAQLVQRLQAKVR